MLLNDEAKGIKLAFLAAIFSGMAIFFNKFAVGAAASPLVFTTVKNSGAAIVIGFLLAVKFKNNWLKIKKLTKPEIVKLIAIGIVGGSLPFYLFFTGLSQIPAVNAAIIHKTLILWVAILAMPFLKEKLSFGQIAAVLILFESNLLIGGFKGFEFSSGELMVLTATILWAVENVVAKKVLKTVNPDLVAAARMGFGSIILLFASFYQNPNFFYELTAFNFKEVFTIIISIVLLTGFVTAWYRALANARAITVAAVLVSASLITNTLSAIFVTHTLNWQFIFQSGLIIFGLWLLFQQTKRQSTIKNSSNNYRITIERL